MSQDGFDSKTLWDKCKNHEETITLIKTDLNTVIGGYNPSKWQDTSKMQNTAGWKGYTDIKNGKPFLFCFLKDKIEIMNHKED